MQFSQLLTIAALSVATVKAADAQDVAFITKLVSDAKAHQDDYINYYATGTLDVPPAFLKLAKQVQTYKDDSYTTLIDSEHINVAQLESFASQLPWATRLQVEAATSAAPSSTEPASSASAQAAPTSTAEAPVTTEAASSAAPTSEAPQPTAAPSSAAPSVAPAPVQPPQNGTTLSTSSASAYSSSNQTVTPWENAGVYKVAPLGAALGAAAIALF